MVNDAVVTFASAFNDNATLLQHIYPTNLDCDVGSYWNDGEKIIENLNKVSTILHESHYYLSEAIFPPCFAEQ